MPRICEEVQGSDFAWVVEGEGARSTLLLTSDFTGWCCSVCEWGMAAPRLDSTVAALAFNRVAQETFEKHDCTRNTQTQNFL